jgi:hypothetical protein
VSTSLDASTLAEITTLHELMFPSIGQCIRIAAEHRLPDLLAGGPLGVDELAARTSTHAGALRSVLHVLADYQIFAEVSPGVFENTPRSNLLRTGTPGSQHTMAEFAGASWLWSCYSNLSHSVATGEAAFDDIFKTNMWAYLAQNPGKARQFNDALTEFSTTLGPRIAESYPEFENADVVADLGGGQGAYLANILSAYPSIGRGVLVEQPSVIEEAKDRPELESLIEKGRLEFFPGDFFTGVPSGVDIYATKQIMHSWNDERLVTLLKRCRNASPGARIAAAEMVQHHDMPRIVKHFDLMMLVTMAGSVRTADDFARAFSQAGYELRRIVPTGTAFSIIEAVPAGEAAGHPISGITG